jgi:hypothetical protein
MPWFEKERLILVLRNPAMIGTLFLAKISVLVAVPKAGRAPRTPILDLRSVCDLVFLSLRSLRSFAAILSTRLSD